MLLIYLFQITRASELIPLTRKAYSHESYMVSITPNHNLVSNEYVQLDWHVFANFLSPYFSPGSARAVSACSKGTQHLLNKDHREEARLIEVRRRFKNSEGLHIIFYRNEFHFGKFTITFDSLPIWPDEVEIEFVNGIGGYSFFRDENGAIEVVLNLDEKFRRNRHGRYNNGQQVKHFTYSVLPLKVTFDPIRHMISISFLDY